MNSSTIEYLIKVAIPLIVICVSLFNLSIKAERPNLWLILLFTSLGYLIPSPKLKNQINNIQAINHL
jgi:hypothetical protein